MKFFLRNIFLVSCLMASSAMADTVAFTQTSFDQLQKAGKPILVHIHANWCPTCRAQSPIISSLLKQNEFKNLTSLRVDFDNQKDIVRAFHVSQQSTLIVFKGGKEVGRSLGDTTPSGIEKLLRKTL
ncbi:MAG: thioredoxin family protein [Methylophilaceae bacterium]